MQTQKKLAKEIKDEGTLTQANDEQATELSKEARFLKEQIATASEKMLKLEKHFESKRKAAELALNEIQNARLAAVQQQTKQKAEAEQNEALATARQYEIDTLQTDHQMAMDRLRLKYGELEENLSTYHNRLREAMSIASSKFRSCSPLHEDELEI